MTSTDVCLELSVRKSGDVGTSRALPSLTAGCWVSSTKGLPPHALPPNRSLLRPRWIRADAGGKVAERTTPAGVVRTMFSTSARPGHVYGFFLVILVCGCAAGPALQPVTGADRGPRRTVQTHRHPGVCGGGGGWTRPRRALDPGPVDDFMSMSKEDEERTIREMAAQTARGAAFGGRLSLTVKVEGGLVRGIEVSENTTDDPSFSGC
ncbi:MAG: hypothetical protein ACI9MC_002744, partial [Kiritimatiellia bacterium]